MVKKIYISPSYLITYFFFLITELLYCIFLVSSYGNTDGYLREMYLFIKQNLKLFVSFNLIYLIIYSFIFPGLGWISFVLTLWRIADICCKEKNKENFQTYCHKENTIFNQPLLENIDKSYSGYSSALGDDKLQCLYSLENNLVKNKKIFEFLTKPRPLYTTSLLSKEMNSD